MTGTPSNRPNFAVLDDWIYEWEIRILGRENLIEEIKNSEEYKLEEKFLRQHTFKSKHQLVEEEEKQLAWDKQLLGFLTELKSLRKQKENDK